MNTSKTELMNELRSIGLGIFGEGLKSHTEKATAILDTIENEKSKGNERAKLMPEALSLFALMISRGVTPEQAKSHIEAGFKAAGI